MNTTIQSTQVNVSERTQSITKVNAIAKPMMEFWRNAEFYRYGVTPIILVIVVGIGAFAGAFVLQESSYKLGIVVLSSSMVQAMIIAVKPMRVIVIAAILSIVLNLLVAIL